LGSNPDGVTLLIINHL